MSVSRCDSTRHRERYGSFSLSTNFVLPRRAPATVHLECGQSSKLIGRGTADAYTTRRSDSERRVMGKTGEWQQDDGFSSSPPVARVSTSRRSLASGLEPWRRFPAALFVLTSSR